MPQRAETGRGGGAWPALRCGAQTSSINRCAPPEEPGGARSIPLLKFGEPPGLRRVTGLRHRRDRGRSYSIFTVIRFGFDSSLRGRKTFRRPCLCSARMRSTSTVGGSEKERRKVPYHRSIFW